MTIHKTALRLPKDLHELILDAAEKSGISMNAEIVTRLRQSFDMPTEKVSSHCSETLIKTIAKETVSEMINDQLETQIRKIVEKKLSEHFRPTINQNLKYTSKLR